MVNRDLARLHHMLDCAKTILKFAEKKQRQDLDSDRFFASAIMREFEVLGEAASAISAETPPYSLESGDRHEKPTNPCIFRHRP
jgi:uncharacterized protein with HEPN domain